MSGDLRESIKEVQMQKSDWGFFMEKPDIAQELKREHCVIEGRFSR